MMAVGLRRPATAERAIDPLPEVLADVAAGVRQALASRGDAADDGRPDAERLRALVMSSVVDAGWVLGTRDLDRLTDRVADQLWRLGPLQPLADLPGVTDILVNGPGNVWIDQGHGLVQTDVALGGDGAGEEQVRSLAVRLAAMAGRRLDEACPWVDARLPGGLRLHAVLPPISPSGTVLSLRLMAPEALSLPDLVQAGTMHPEWAGVLEQVVRSRLAFLISGGTGAGKTTLLSSLLGLVPSGQRIVLVEDVGELQPQHDHVVRLEARQANAEGRGQVALDDLVRQALRMRPDRLVVGECRGAEVRDLLGALNTGHEGGCGTVHANTARDVPARLQALGALAGLSPAAISVQAAAALDVVIHIERGERGRRVTEIACVGGAEGGELALATALDVDPADPTGPGLRGPGWPALAERLDRGRGRR